MTKKSQKRKTKMITALESKVPTIRSILDGNYSLIDGLATNEYQSLFEYMRPMMRSRIKGAPKPEQVKAIVAVLRRHYSTPIRATVAVPSPNSPLHHEAHLLIPPCIHLDLLIQAKVHPLGIPWEVQLCIDIPIFGDVETLEGAQ